MSPLLSRQPIGLDEQGLSYSVLAAQSRILQLLGDGVAGREVAAEICRIAAERFAGVGCAILTLDGAATHLTVLAVGGAAAAHSPPSSAASRPPSRVRSSGRSRLGAPEFCAAMQGGARVLSAARCGPRRRPRVLLVGGDPRPSRGRNRAALTGVVCLFHPERKRPGPRGVKVLELLASLAGLAVERAARARDAMRSAATDSAHERWVDPLTQLPGRQLFERMLRDLIGASDPDTTRFALLLIDVDRFLDINERYGSRLGDILLASFARRMQKALRRGDLAARLEGDCFALLVRMGDDADEASRLAGRFREEGRRSFDFDGQSIALTVSVGVGVFPWDGSQGAMLLANAEVALRAARAAGGDGFRIYSASLRAEPPRGERRRDVARGGRGALGDVPIGGVEHGAIALPVPRRTRGRRGSTSWSSSGNRSSRSARGAGSDSPPASPGGVREARAPAPPTSGGWRRAPAWCRRSCAGTCATRWATSRARPATCRRRCGSRSRSAAPALATEGFVGTVVELLAGERLAPEPVATRDPGAGAGARRRRSDEPPRDARRASGVRLELSGVGSGNLPLEALTEIAWSGWKLDAYLVRTARARPEVGALASGLIALAREMKAVSIAEQVDEALDLTWLGLHRCDLAQGAALRRPVAADQLARDRSRSCARTSSCC